MGGLFFADDGILLAPSRSAAEGMLKICESCLDISLIPVHTPLLIVLGIVVFVFEYI